MKKTSTFIAILFTFIVLPSALFADAPPPPTETEFAAIIESRFPEIPERIIEERWHAFEKWVGFVGEREYRLPERSPLPPEIESDPALAPFITMLADIEAEEGQRPIVMFDANFFCVCIGVVDTDISEFGFDVYEGDGLSSFFYIGSASGVYWNGIWVGFYGEESGEAELFDGLYFDPSKYKWGDFDMNPTWLARNFLSPLQWVFGYAVIR